MIPPLLILFPSPQKRKLEFPALIRLPEPAPKKALAAFPVI
jgi:hypothetical protein